MCLVFHIINQPIVFHKNLAFLSEILGCVNNFLKISKALFLEI